VPSDGHPGRGGGEARHEHDVVPRLPLRAGSAGCDAGAVLVLPFEEVAFYDALAGRSDDWTADPKLAEIARALVRGIKDDLTVDWADHETTEAAIRVKIKHLLRRFKYRPAAGGGRSVDRVVDLVLDQARTLYRFWPEVYSELPI